VTPGIASKMTQFRMITKNTRTIVYKNLFARNERRVNS
jgi:hypothetical protein